MLVTYVVDGTTLETNAPREVEGVLGSALALAALHSFHLTKPVIICLNGQPYRVVSVEFVDSTTKTAFSRK